MLGLVNAVLTTAFDLVIGPLIGLAPRTTLVAISIATGLAMLWVIGRTSNQAGIADAKRAIQAGLFEIRLFNDNLLAVLRALRRVLWHNVRYLGYSLVPLAWVAVPLTLGIAQLQAFYGYEGLRAGDPVVLTIRLGDPGATLQARHLELDAPDGLRVDTPAVVLPGAAEVLWRVVPERAGSYTVTARLDDLALTKTLDASAGAVRRSPLRSGHLLDLLLYPSEPPLPENGPATAVAVGYPAPGLEIAGVRVHWLIVYVVVSMATAFAFAGRFGVTI